MIHDNSALGSECIPVKFLKIAIDHMSSTLICQLFQSSFGLS